ncbi:winged helix-turn-helix domain-containing protein [Yoonia sp. R2-816]|uniref:winged helix-turn-helix domain-containing protein n=1 Tax=Yoonia sp. R2-816 TaxID=3342638 RepID=UPI00372AE3CE
MTQKPSHDPAQPRDIARIVPDTTALKALAHPERLRMLGLLRVEGPATATGIAKRLGLNSGATSYHLRQLAKHGFIAEAEDLGTKRERWWQAQHDTTVFDVSDQSGEVLQAGLAMSQAVISQHMEFLQSALGEYPNLPTPWRRVSGANDIIIPVTVEQAQTLTDKLMNILMQARSAHPRQDAPLSSDTRNFMIVMHSFPFPEISQASAGDAEE